MTTKLTNRVARNTIWNLAGQLLPMLIGIATIPLLIERLGIDRFGFLTLVWVLIGYAGVFDLGISRAMTRVLARGVAENDQAAIQRVSRGGLSLMLGFGCVLAVLLAASSYFLVENWLGVPKALQEESLRSFLLLCLSIPFVMLTNGYGGCLQAYQKFPELNRIRMLMGVATYLGPLLIVLFIQRLEPVVAFVVLMRVGANYLHRRACRRYCSLSFLPCLPDRQTVHELFSLGGWIAVSNVISPLMTYLDRLIIGGILPVKMIAYYSTPYDVLSKMMVIPYAFTNAVFPVAAGLGGDLHAARKVYHSSLRVVFSVMYFPILAVIVLAHPALELWLGGAFADQAAPAMQILAAGILFNIVAQVPATLIQAYGNPKWMAMLHVAELPVFVGVLWFLTNEFGIMGTALAATLRFFVDALLVFVLLHMNVMGRPLRPARLALTLAPFFLILLFAAMPSGLSERLAYLGVSSFFLIGVDWFFVLSNDERGRLGSFFVE